jgi:hypothetical protein
MVYTYRYGWWVVLILLFVSPWPANGRWVPIAWGCAALLAAVFLAVRLTIGNEIQGMSDEARAAVVEPFLEQEEQIRASVIASWCFVAAVTSERLLIVRMSSRRSRPDELVTSTSLREITLKRVRRPFVEILVVRTVAGQRWSLDLIHQSRLAADQIADLLNAEALAGSRAS